MMILRTIFDKWNILSMTMITYNQRLSLLIIILTTLSVLLVVTSAAAFVYVTRKEKVLRKSHLITVISIIFVELAFLIAVVTCCSIQSTNTQGQILAALLIILSFLALMILIYFLLEDILKERIVPDLQNNIPVRTFIVQEQKTTDRPQSPVPPPTVVPADEIAIPILTSPVLPSLPRLPTPPVPHESPLPPLLPSSSPVPPPSEKLGSPPATPSFSEHPESPISEQQIPQLPESPPPYVTNYERIRRDLLAAIDERTIPALEEAIQQVKDHEYIQPLKYECERALELLNRLMKIEHMKIRVLRLNQATIAELHSYTKPPDEVLTVMRATFLLLGHSEREIQDWPQIQSLLGRFGRESIRRRCYELNPLSISVDKAHEAKDILRNYDLIRVTEISVGLAAFFNWSTTMVEEREKLLESQRRINR